MERKINENDNSCDSIISEEEEEIKLYKGIMNQKISKKNIILSKEISKKKKIINRLFKERFGKHFIPIKLESLKAFENFVKFYLFSPQSKILNKFPKLKKKLLHEKDINYNALNDKINIGSLLYLSLSGNGTNLNKNINEKFFQISKNLSTSISKDTISNHVYNVKFLKKNAQRITKILSYKGKKMKEIDNITIINKNKNIINQNEKENLKGKISKNKNKGRNFSNDNFKNTITAISYKTYGDFNKINNNENLSDNRFYSLNTDDENFPFSHKSKKSLHFFNNNSKSKSIKSFQLQNNPKKFNSRNINSNITKYEGFSTYMSNEHNNVYSTKSFSPYSTFSHFNRKNNYFTLKQAKHYQSNINKYVENLNNEINKCNNKLIKLINGNIKQKIKTPEEENQEVINLKKILIDKKKSKKKQKVNNIIQIKRLIKNAKLDIEGEAKLEKIRKKELKKLGHYLNIMNNDYALYKANELFTKEQLKREGKNFAQEELMRLRKKKIREIKVFHSRKNIKDNYLKIIKMKNDLALMKDKFEKIDTETTNRAIDINKKKRNLTINV